MDKSTSPAPPSSSASPKTRAWKRILAALLLLGAAAIVWELHSSQNPEILSRKRQVKYEVLDMTTERESEAIGLDHARCVCYVDGEPGAPLDFSRDCKRTYDDGSTTRLVNYLDGYQLDFPAGTTFDFSLSPLRVVGTGADFDVAISREEAPFQSRDEIIPAELATFFPFLSIEDTTQTYINYYEYRFLADEIWQENNHVTVTEDTTAGGISLLHCTVAGLPDDVPDGYTFVTVRNGLSREYLRILFRYQAEDTTTRDALCALLDGTRLFDPVGQGHYATDFSPTLPQNWSEETSALYADIVAGDQLRWGIFTQDVYGTGIHETIPALEEALDYKFSVILSYVHFGTPFPTEFMKENRQNGRIVELTYQITGNNNEDLYAASPLLDLYRGLRDDELRAFARAAADYGHPFLFRLNNEMNSDWTSYSGVVNLGDPQLFIAVWQRIYRIFEEEGVDNCIWIYNPNDRNAPPSRWNDALAYYPGNEYVQMLGVTGYNNGTYYAQWKEQWREFDVIYDEIESLYAPHFSKFPWIITEFASSSIGGDKVAWIENMFAHIRDYPNLKIAVWFSYADFDGDTPARPYWLDETEGSLAAFRTGLAGSGKTG